MAALYLIYIANIIVAGWISVTSLFAPKTAAATVFSNAYETTEVMRLVGCLWLGIAALSVFGLWRPITFQPVLLMQLIYKGTWLLVVALPALRQNQPFPQGMAVCFLIWCLVLPFIIQWKTLLG
jgi:hypothetical protein